MTIVCISISRFAVEAERQRSCDPSHGKTQDRLHDIASRLLLIGEATVFDCSLGAEASNVRRGMRTSEAIGLCPQALVLAPDIPHYQRQFEEVLDFLEEHSPAVEASNLGTAYLSLKGLRVEPQPFAGELIASLHLRLGFMASVGIASGKFTARVASTVSPPGVTTAVSDREGRAFLAPLSVGYLPASEAMRWRLDLLGLETIGDIARLPLGAFQQQFGPDGKRCWELANGIDDEPLLRRMQQSPVVRHLEMPAPTACLDTILMGVERLIYAAYATPDRQGRWVRKVVVRAALDGGGSWELPVAFREALAHPRDAWFAVKAAIVRRPPERPVEELELELIGLSGESGKQATMFEGKGKLWRQLEEAVRQLGAQQGATSIGKVVEIEPWSRIPERRAALADYDL